VKGALPDPSDTCMGDIDFNYQHVFVTHVVKQLFNDVCKSRRTR